MLGGRWLFAPVAVSCFSRPGSWYNTSIVADSEQSLETDERTSLCVAMVE